MSMLPFDVRSIQRGLNGAGYPVGQVDGKFGQRTQDALQKYLSDHGMPGAMSKSVAEKMRSMAASQATPKMPVPPADAAKAADRAHKAGEAANRQFGDKKPASRQPCPKLNCPKTDELGVLSKQYESGARGAAAIGYDTTGGWSYGTYQVETESGTMKKFMASLKDDAPALHDKLEQAGGAAAAKEGTKAFKDAWVEAAGDPAFAEAQHDFIKGKLYDPQVEKISTDTGLDVASRSPALQNVVWSVAVQHGKSASVVTRALHGKDVAKMSDEQIIDAIYDERSATAVDAKGKEYVKYFKNSTPAVQKAQLKRFDKERACAKKMLASASNDSKKEIP